MGQHTLVVIPHDVATRIELDSFFGKRLVSSIMARGNPNIPTFAYAAHSVQLGPQFHSNDTLLVSIEDGAIVRLSIEEQIYLEESLGRFRKKKQKEGAQSPAAR